MHHLRCMSSTQFICLCQHIRRLIRTRKKQVRLPVHVVVSRRSLLTKAFKSPIPRSRRLCRKPCRARQMRSNFSPSSAASRTLFLAWRKSFASPIQICRTEHGRIRVRNTGQLPSTKRHCKQNMSAFELDEGSMSWALSVKHSSFISFNHGCAELGMEWDT